MRYQAQMFWPFQQRWTGLNGLQSCMACAILACWQEQELWSRSLTGIIPECRIGLVDKINRITEYVPVPYDADYNDPQERNPEIVMSRWRCAVESARYVTTTECFEAMMART